MRFFNRRAAAVDADTATATGTPHTTERKLHGRHHYSSGGAFNARPTFGEWIRGTALDLITMLILGAIGLGVSFFVQSIAVS
jgi:diacylglycerol diphosphate phosphatase / phosphatidate phosphatase